VNPRTENQLQQYRILMLGILCALVALILLGRLWYLQVAKGADLLKDSETNRLRLLRTRAARGTILDRNGRVLATSRPQFVVMATPETLDKAPDAKHTLCGILQIRPDDLAAIFKKASGRTGSPVRVAMDVPLEIVAEIGEMRMRLPGVSVELDHIRLYNNGPATCHAIGYLGEISQEELDSADREGRDYRLGDYVGKSGLERQYEQTLRGRDGGKQIEVNAFGRAVRELGSRPSVAGHTLKLTLDLNLQKTAFKALGSQVGAVVAIDPRSGEVLAMASNPGFDPNIFVKKVKASDWSKIVNNRAHPMQNRCVSNTYPPGSTFKPIMAIAGLRDGACTVHTGVSCSGAYYLGSKRFRCWKTHGSVGFMDAMAESCDIWFYTVCRRLGIDKMAAAAGEFGIGRSPGIDLPGGGASGIMPSREWKRKQLNQPWYPGDTVNTSIGQGFVLTSPLQMAMVCAAVANGGTVYRPYLVNETFKPDGSEVVHTEREALSTVDASLNDWRLVQRGMIETVSRGTGKVCDLPGIAVAGKTGSAQAGHKGAHGWFICYAPAENPKIAVAAIVEHGKHGATTAAPICRSLLEVFFGLKKPVDVKESRANVSGD